MGHGLLDTKLLGQRLLAGAAGGANPLGCVGAQSSFTTDSTTWVTALDQAGAGRLKQIIADDCYVKVTVDGEVIHMGGTNDNTAIGITSSGAWRMANTEYGYAGYETPGGTDANMARVIMDLNVDFGTSLKIEMASNAALSTTMEWYLEMYDESVTAKPVANQGRQSFSTTNNALQTAYSVSGNGVLRTLRAVSVTGFRARITADGAVLHHGGFLSTGTMALTKTIFDQVDGSSGGWSDSRYTMCARVDIAFSKSLLIELRSITSGDTSTLDFNVEVSA